MINERWMHVKRGTTYIVVAEAFVDTSEPLKDMQEAVLFRIKPNEPYLVQGIEEFANSFKTGYDVEFPRIQTATELRNGEQVVVYGAESDGSLWARSKTEFHNGRFIQLAEESKMKPQYEPKTITQKLGYVVEECGEVLAAIGKAQRWGLESFNPEIPINERRTNRDWILRELSDLQAGINILRKDLINNQPEKYCLMTDQEFWDSLNSQKKSDKTEQDPKS